MNRLILFSLFLTAVNCQLAYVWLNYHHFQCVQNTRNYHESIHHQYLCTSSLIRTCIHDDNAYTYSSVISLDYFCGFIDGRNALQPRTIWNIHLKPNIKIQFLKFLLSHYYWYCDYEFLRIYSNTDTSTFCGNRFPWAYDASNTRLKIMLVTYQPGRDNYQLELLYYGAYVPTKSQHFVIFIQQASIINTHIPNTEQNAFESFHFVSSSRLNILQLEAMNICSKEHVICYDGPGIKSPILQFTSNQSEWECLATTFQMVCKFSRPNDCTKVPYLRYHSVGARHVHHLDVHWRTDIPLDINRIGTTKYIYYHQDTEHYVEFVKLYENYPMFLTFPSMLYEGHSCMYGGVYIVKTLLSKDVELFLLCTSSTIYSEGYDIKVSDLYNISLLVIHYSEYSSKRLTFIAYYAKNSFHDMYDVDILELRELTLVNQQYLNETTIDFTVPTLPLYAHVFIKSYLLKLRKVQYINISFDNESTVLYLWFGTIRGTSCINITIFYSQHLSNLRGRQYDQETRYWDKRFRKRGLIKSVFMNMNTCDLWNVPVWVLDIETYDDGLTSDTVNTSVYFNVPTVVNLIQHYLQYITQHKFWIMIHVIRPDKIDQSVDTIHLVNIWVYNIVFRVSMEVPTDDYQSSSVYGWNNVNGFRGAYIIVNRALNILFEYDSSTTKVHKPVSMELQPIFDVMVIRHLFFCFVLFMYTASVMFDYYCRDSELSYIGGIGFQSTPPFGGSWGL